MSVLERNDKGELEIRFTLNGWFSHEDIDNYTDELLRLARIGAEAEKACRECNKELHVVVSKMEKTTMTAEKAIEMLKPQLYQDRKTVFVGRKLIPSECAEIAKLIERLQTCQTCEKQSNQFFGKCEGCENAKEVMKD